MSKTSEGSSWWTRMRQNKLHIVTLYRKYARRHPPPDKQAYMKLRLLRLVWLGGYCKWVSNWGWVDGCGKGYPFPFHEWKWRTLVHSVLKVKMPARKCLIFCIHQQGGGHCPMPPKYATPYEAWCGPSLIPKRPSVHSLRCLQFSSPHTLHSGGFMGFVGFGHLSPRFPLLCKTANYNGKLTTQFCLLPDYIIVV